MNIGQGVEMLLGAHRNGVERGRDAQRFRRSAAIPRAWSGMFLMSLLFRPAQPSTVPVVLGREAERSERDAAVQDHPLQQSYAEPYLHSSTRLYSAVLNEAQSCLDLAVPWCLPSRSEIAGAAVFGRSDVDRIHFS